MLQGLAAAAVALVAEAAHAQPVCTLPPQAGTVLQAPPVSLAWKPERAPIIAGHPFSLIVTLCPAQARLQAVDATMPEHRHGMNYQPSVLPLGGGRWRVQGLLWHMAGRWELRFDVDHAGAVQVLRQSMVLP